MELSVFLASCHWPPAFPSPVVHTHPAFTKSPGYCAEGGLVARSEQVEPRVWASECEVGPQSQPLSHCSTSPPFPLLSFLYCLSSSIFPSSLLLFHLSSSPPPPLQWGKGIMGCLSLGGAQAWCPALEPSRVGRGFAALTLGSLLVGAGKRGRRNSVGSLDSTIEVSASSCPTCPLHEPCPGHGAPEEEGTCCFPVFPARNCVAASPSQPLSPSVLSSVCPHSACLSVCLPLSHASSQPQGQLQVGTPLDLGHKKLLPPRPALSP